MLQWGVRGPWCWSPPVPLTWRATPASYTSLIKQGLQALAPQWPWAGPALLRASVYQAGREVTTPRGVEKAGGLKSRCVQSTAGPHSSVCVCYGLPRAPPNSDTLQLEAQPPPLPWGSLSTGSRGHAGWRPSCRLSTSCSQGPRESPLL